MSQWFTAFALAKGITLAIVLFCHFRKWLSIRYAPIPVLATQVITLIALVSAVVLQQVEFVPVWILDATCLAGIVFEVASLCFLFFRLDSIYRQTQLEQTNRSLELKKTQGKLIEAAHRAGMADIATGLLHNIGNVLNGIKVSSELLQRQVKDSSSSTVIRVIHMLEEHERNLGQFLQEDERGQKVFDLLKALAKQLPNEQQFLNEEIHNIATGAQSIADIVAEQQSYAHFRGVFEEVEVSDLIDSVLVMTQSSLDRNRIQVTKIYQKNLRVTLHRSKITQTILNLVQNARDAIVSKGEGRGSITISTQKRGHFVLVRFKDSGTGINPQHLNSVFLHGFTTKDKGHGFGLHTCANYMIELGGSIKVASDGPGKGATFTLWIPEVPVKKAPSFEDNAEEAA